MNAGSLDIAARGLNALLMIGFGLALGAFVARRWNQPWGLFGIGAVTFVLSQVAHIPFNSLVLNALFTRLGWTDPASVGTLVGVAASLGLSAGVFEESARWLMFRLWARKARRWEEALMIGAGHGGIEAILLGGLAVYALIQVLALQGTDLASVVPADQVETARLQVEAYWAAPWYAALLGALERVLALCLHLSLSVLVLQAFVRRRWIWLFLAIGWHAFVDGAAVAASQVVGPYWTEALIGVFALLSLAIVAALRDSAGKTPQAGAAPVSRPPIGRQDEPPSVERLDDSRFAASRG
jgi:uncharacterized membrane protein YhfC